jgi:molybdopterin/thiamine biosynthesis adenylyltransferase
MKSPSAELGRGRLALDSLSQVQVIAEWRWIPSRGDDQVESSWDEIKERREEGLSEDIDNKNEEDSAIPREHWREGTWVLHCSLTIPDQGSKYVPATTQWYVCADADYPRGDIKFYPAKKGSIVSTFQHQDYNGPGHRKLPWRAGAPCLDTTTRILGLHGGNTEPKDADYRLAWHFSRALTWLHLAATDALTAVGEHFELPYFPLTYPKDSRKRKPRAPGRNKSDEPDQIRVVFNESAASFAVWEGCKERAGFVDFSLVLKGSRLIVVKAFRSIEGNPIVVPSWGSVIKGVGTDSRTGIWLRLDKPPVMRPWQSPTEWGELRDVLREQGIPIDSLKELTARLRDGRRHMALFGFPMADIIGTEPSIMHWQAVQLPILSQSEKENPGARRRRGRRGAHGIWHTPKDTTTADGFRPGEKGYWHNDVLYTLNGDRQVSWIKSENWHQEQISTRGRFSNSLLGSRILLIGAGAVGSVVSELLVRAGVEQITIVDHDKLQVGNLARHTLSIDDVGISKATRLAERLNLIAPHACADSICTNFPPISQEERMRIQQCDIILDCTAEDDVLHYMETFPWETQKLFVSVSVGREAKILYCFAAYADRFPQSTFTTSLGEYASIASLPDRDATVGESPRDGIGCWHPVFPARADDITLMASVAVKYIDTIISSDSAAMGMAVFQQQSEGGLFTGVKRVELGVPCA